jgi:hypothetical protein
LGPYLQSRHQLLAHVGLRELRREGFLRHLQEKDEQMRHLGVTLYAGLRGHGDLQLRGLHGEVSVPRVATLLLHATDLRVLRRALLLRLRERGMLVLWPVTSEVGPDDVYV